MATLAEQLQLAVNSKTAVKNALIAKGVDMTGVSFSSYAEKIATISVGSSSEAVTSFEGVKEFTSLADMTELNNYATVGALISYKDGDAKPFKVWNGDQENLAWNWKDTNIAESELEEYTYDSCGNTVTGYKLSVPQNAAYGTTIAVCVGLGKWASIDWSRSQNKLMWATSNTALYNNMCDFAVHSTGAAITRHMFGNAQHMADSPLFAAVKAFAPVEATRNHWFVPAKYELLDMQNNCCSKDNHNDEQECSSAGQCEYNNRLGKLLALMPGYYWSASQSGGYSDYGYAFYVYFDYGYVGDYYGKSNEYLSQVLLHFGDALASSN